MSVCVYTALFGDGPDQLREPPQYPEVRYVAFTDRAEAPGWEIHRGHGEEHDPRRRARYHKCLPNVVLPGEDLTVWVDATHEPVSHMLQYAHDVLGEDKDFATYKHRERTCLYQEVRACIGLHKDDPRKLIAQARLYESDGYPYYHGLCETSVVVRRNTAGTRTLGAMWWREIEQGSVRDQVSLPYVLWKLRRSYARLPGWAHTNPIGFRFHSHWQCASAST